MKTLSKGDCVRLGALAQTMLPSFAPAVNRVIVLSASQRGKAPISLSCVMLEGSVYEMGYDSATATLYVLNQVMARSTQ